MDGLVTLRLLLAVASRSPVPLAGTTRGAFGKQYFKHVWVDLGLKQGAEFALSGVRRGGRFSLRTHFAAKAAPTLSGMRDRALRGSMLMDLLGVHVPFC